MLIDLVYFLNIVLSFIVGFYLLFQLKPLYQKKHTIPLALYFILNAFCFSFYLLIKYEYILYVPYLYKIPAPITYLIAPFAYFHIRFIIFRNEKIKLIDWLHFIPFTIFFISYFEFYFIDFEDKKYYVNLIISDFSLTYTDNIGILPEYINSIGRIIHPFFYILLQWMLLKSSHAKALKQKDQKLFQWVFNFTLLQTIFTLSLFITVISLQGVTKGIEDSFLSTLPAILTITFFFTLSIYLLWNQDILRKLKYFKINDNKDKIRMTNKLSEIRNIVENEAYFTDVDLTITKLSSLLQISQQELSNLINAEYSSYNEWINEIRTNHSIALLKNNFLKTYGIEYLALKSGFKSKNTFYRSFKKVTNTTPTQFIKSFNEAKNMEKKKI